MLPFSILELENFRSFKEKTIIEWKQMSLIFGLNGSGKTTLVNAIEFLFCLPPYDKTSFEVVKGMVRNKDDSTHSKTAVIGKLYLDDREITFKRSIEYNNSACKYWINNEELNAKGYTKRLLEYNIDKKANNIINNENTVANIALQNSQQRREYFECLSNSILYKSSYERLLKELQAQATELKTMNENLKRYRSMKKKLQKQSKDVEKYTKLREKLDSKEYDYHFAKLLKVSRFMNATVKEQEELELKIKTIVQKLKPPVEKEIKEIKDKLKELKDRLMDIKKESIAKNDKVSKNSLKLIAIDQKIASCKENIKDAERNLKSAERVCEEHQNIKRDLKMQYNSVDDEKNEYCQSQIQNYSQESDEQYKEYLSLKKTVQEKCVQVQCMMIDSIERERNSLKTRIDDYDIKRESLILQINKKEAILKEANSKIDYGYNKIKEITLERDLAVENRIKLDNQIDDMKRKSEVIEDSINELTIQISENKLMKEDSKRDRRKRARLEDLKNTFPGVRGRLKHLCDVSEDKYKIAVTKILESKMDHIIVDTTSTAMNCIQYLKTKYKVDELSAVETFQPLQSGCYQDISLDHFRGFVNNFPTARLAIDVIDTVPEMKNLLKNVFVKKTVIFETDEQADKFTYNYKVNCVSLNGTLYKRDGTFSGGYADLSRRSEEWNEMENQEKENEYQFWKEQRDAKIAQLRQLHGDIRNKEEEKNILDNKLAKLTKIVQIYLEPQCKKQESEVEDMNREIIKLKSDLCAYESKQNEMKNLRNQLNEKNARLQELEMRKNEIEKAVFADFCRRYDIRDIRGYEQNDFKKYREYEERMKQFDNLLDKIKNQLEYERSRNTKQAVKKWKDRLNEMKEVHEKLIKKRQNQSKKTEENLEKIKELKSIEMEIDNLKKIMKLKEFTLNSMEEDLVEFRTSLASKNSRINNLRADRHNIFRECKINGINIPLYQGTMQKVDIDTMIDMDAQSSSDSNKESRKSQIEETEVDVDFSKLSSKIRNLGEDGLNNHILSLGEEIEEFRKVIESMRPQSKSVETINSIMEKVKALQTEYNEKRFEHDKTEKAFDAIKEKRTIKLTNFFEVVRTNLIVLFKDLYKNELAQAHIHFTNLEEPYLGGIDFNCIIPKKKFSSMKNLSGGEKTMCAMALFFAIHKAKPAPCLIFDEIDAFLDNYSLKKIVKFIMDCRSQIQIIFVSHRHILAESANAGIGISFHPEKGTSHVIHIDFDKYRRTYDFEGKKLVKIFDGELNLLHRYQDIEVGNILSQISEGDEHHRYEEFASVVKSPKGIMIERRSDLPF